MLFVGLLMLTGMAEASHHAIKKGKGHRKNKVKADKWVKADTWGHADKWGDDKWGHADKWGDDKWGHADSWNNHGDSWNSNHHADNWQHDFSCGCTDADAVNQHVEYKGRCYGTLFGADPTSQVTATTVAACGIGSYTELPAGYEIADAGPDTVEVVTGGTGLRYWQAIDLVYNFGSVSGQSGETYSRTDTPVGNIPLIPCIDSDDNCYVVKDPAGPGYKPDVCGFSTTDVAVDTLIVKQCYAGGIEHLNAAIYDNWAPDNWGTDKWGNDDKWGTDKWA